jgi:drug/metabolite transporter (DMT)-like permease
LPKPPLPRILVDNAADTVRGILLVTLSYLMFTISDATAKWALPVAGISGVMIWRGLFGTASIVLIASATGTGWRRLVPVRWWLVLLRAGLSSGITFCWYYSWLTMSLVDTYAIGFSAPLIMIVLAVPLLGERLAWRRTLSTVIGFAGVLLMLRPGGEIDIWTPALPVLAIGIFFLAFSRILTRWLSTTETAESLAMTVLLSHCVTGIAIALFHPPPGAFNGWIWLLMVLLGATSALAQVLNARSFALAPVSALAPYEYTGLIWAGLLGFALFHEVPAWTTLIGAGIVIAAGLYNLHRERQRRVAAVVGT